MVVMVLIRRNSKRGGGVVDYFEVLGVSVDASDAEIASAYKRLAKQFHPDQHPEAGPAEKVAWGSMMARINEAWSVLGDSAKRATYLQQRKATESTPQEEPQRPPRRGECDLCGCGPAVPFKYQHQVAYLFAARMYTVEFEMCSSCSIALGRSAQNRTLLTGWWGVISILRNIGVVFNNAQALQAALKMPQPWRSENVVAPLSAPLEIGRAHV